MWNGSHFGPSWPEVTRFQRRSPSGTPPTRRVAEVHVQKNGTLRVSVERRLLSTGFRGICSFAALRPLFHVPIDNASRSESIRP